MSTGGGQAGRSPITLLLVLVWCTLLLTSGDQFHTQFQIIVYPRAFFFGQAWWVAPGFAIAAIGFVGIAWPFVARANAVPTRGRDVVVEAAWFFAIYALSGVFGRWSVTLAIAFTVVWAVRVARRAAGDRALIIRFSLLLAVLGTLGEELLHATGVCRYAVRDLGLVPLWLPALYLNGAPLALALARWLSARAET